MLKDEDVGHGTVGKTAVVGIVERKTNKVRAIVVENKQISENCRSL